MVERRRGIEIGGQCPPYNYNRRIIHKHAVALKALNPRELKHKDIICCQLFWSRAIIQN
jgi:hypothetical protein